MRYETKINFAKRAGISRQAVYQLIRDGKLVQTTKGKLDVNNPTNKEYLSNKKHGIKKPETKAIKADKAKPEDKKPSTNQDDQPKDYNPEDLNTISHTSANKLKTIEGIRKIQIANDTARLELVSRDSVKMILSKLYQIDVNQWRTLGPNLSPEIAAIVGTDDNETMLKISDAIDKEAFTILKQVKRILNDFLKDIKSDGIK